MSTSLTGFESLIYLVKLLGGFGGLPVNQNPKTDTIVNSIWSIAGRDKKTSIEEVEKQLSIFDTQLSTMQIFASIPQFAPFISPLLTNIKEQKAALELVYDHFDAFSGGDGYIDKYDVLTIREAAYYDDNEADFSEEDLEELYDLNGYEYDPTEEFSLSSMSFNKEYGRNRIDNTRLFGDRQSEKNILISDDRGNDTYTVSEYVEDSNLVFTALEDGDMLNLEGAWRFEEIVDDETDDDYVLYINENTGTNVFVKGRIDDVKDLVNVGTPT